MSAIGSPEPAPNLELLALLETQAAERRALQEESNARTQDMNARMLACLERMQQCLPTTSALSSMKSELAAMREHTQQFLKTMQGWQQIPPSEDGKSSE